MENTQEGLNFLELVFKGGLVMVPIGLLSVITIYLIIERFIFIQKSSKLEANFLNNLKDLLAKGDLKAARAFCQRVNSPISRVIEKGVMRIGKPIKDIESSIESMGSLETSNLEKNLNWLGIIAGIAPMLGFIGTISGIIKIFYNISVSDNISIGLIAGGLYEKMITSGAGLVVGVVAYTGYHLLNTLIDKFNTKLERTAVDFIDILDS
jgi:biopolymer transport protein ExbB